MTESLTQPSALLLVANLQSRLDEIADIKVKDWFETYLKHVVPYRGVKTPDVSKTVTAWSHAHGICQFPSAAQLSLAKTLIQQNHAEDKFAGIFYIQKYLLRKLAADALFETAENLFKNGAFIDWSTTDWFCVRVLGPAIKIHGQSLACRIGSWSHASNLWQRRASIVSLKAPAYHSLIKTTVAALVKDDARFIQTGIGWVISDLAKKFPDVAEKMVESHFENLSIEVIRRHTKYLPDHQSYIKRKRI